MRRVDHGGGSIDFHGEERGGCGAFAGQGSECRTGFDGSHFVGLAQQRRIGRDGHQGMIRQDLCHLRTERLVKARASVAGFGEKHAALHQELPEVCSFVFTKGKIGGACEIEQRGFEHRGIGERNVARLEGHGCAGRLVELAQQHRQRGGPRFPRSGVGDPADAQAARLAAGGVREFHALAQAAAGLLHGGDIADEVGAESACVGILVSPAFVAVFFPAHGDVEA